MPFKPPQWAPALPEILDNVSIPDITLDEFYGRQALKRSRPPFICALSGRTSSAAGVKETIDHLVRGIAAELGWQPNVGGSLSKVVCVFGFNTVDYLPLIWAVHRIGGVVTLTNGRFSAADLASQLKDSGARSIFTCLPLLNKAVEAAAVVGILNECIFALDALGQSSLPKKALDKSHVLKSTTVLAQRGANLPTLELLEWSKGEAKRQVVFLCYSSGTSGLPK
ncbi:hypothetical protein CEP52_017542 [Fusarium oligoseptatum]|uniref:AMP-dependent synthetase/ligase domain-containing protein n=1 Tax=Fusarium oligoseptatum TaxID=2604345 RepID=A0A428RNX5_9HYPO|nr:hypothetical protein CEP52_017542 [Fusarium oligoseptatum]